MKTFEPNKEMKEWDYVYVSVVSEEHAIQDKNKKILLRKCSDWYVTIVGWYEEKYLKWDAFIAIIWDYAVPALKTITIEVTEEQEEQINNILKK